MVLIQFFVGVVYAVGLNVTFQLLKLTSLDFRVANVNSDFLGDGELSLHFLDSTLSEGEIKGVFQGVERSELVTGPVILDIGEDQVLETALFDHTGNQTDGLLFTDGVLYANTVLDVLQNNLTAQCSVLIAVHFLFNAVVFVLNQDLRKQLLTGCIGRGVVGCSNIPGVGEENLTGGSIDKCNFAGELFVPNLTAVLLFDQDHVCHFVFCSRIGSLDIVIQRFAVVVYLILPGGRNRLDGSGNECAERHYQGQSSRCNSFDIHS